MFTLQKMVDFASLVFRALRKVSKSEMLQVLFNRIKIFSQSACFEPARHEKFESSCIMKETYFLIILIHDFYFNMLTVIGSK